MLEYQIVQGVVLWCPVSLAFGNSPSSPPVFVCCKYVYTTCAAAVHAYSTGSNCFIHLRKVVLKRQNVSDTVREKGVHRWYLTKIQNVT